MVLQCNARREKRLIIVFAPSNPEYPMIVKDRIKSLIVEKVFSKYDQLLIIGCLLPRDGLHRAYAHSKQQQQAPYGCSIVGRRTFHDDL